MPMFLYELIVEGQDRNVYSGAAPIISPKTLPESHRSVTTTSQFALEIETTSVAQITVDPEVYGGIPCVSDGRMPIARILEKLASGVSIDLLLQNYPDLTLADIRLALEAAATLMRDPSLNWSEINLAEMVEFRRELQDWQSLGDNALNVIDDSLR
jgi:uncharacterized protein (DUF433 family)